MLTIEEIILITLNSALAVSSILIRDYEAQKLNNMFYEVIMSLQVNELICNIAINSGASHVYENKIN